nr:uncharacterized protein LOC106627465 isoform X4 [Bactrocera oleae]
MKCAVANCRSDNHSKASNCSFYIFPSNMELAKKWVEFCRREDYFNPKTSFICMKHFTRDDFGNNLQFEMASDYNKPLNQENTGVEIFVDELVLRRRRQNAERARAYRKRKKDLASGLITHEMLIYKKFIDQSGYAKNRLLKRGVVPSIYEYSSEGSEMNTTSDQHATHRTEWSELYVKENLKIINLVKTNPLVYTSPSMEVRHEMWEQIDVACGFNKPQSKKRWERLLSDFYLHILNVSKKTQPNDGLPTPNKGNIKFHDYYYFKDMLFMMPYIKSIVGDAKLKAIQEEIKKEDNTRVNKNRDVTLETIDISEDIEIPSTSKTLTVTSRKTAHKDYVTIKDIDETPIEIKVDNNVYKIEMSTSECLESPDYDNLIKQNTLITERTNTQQTCSTNTAKTNLTTTGVMTDRKSATPYENLLPEEKSLKAFFDAMLGATQRLPEFHQRRIKGDLMKALRHQGVDITE